MDSEVVFNTGAHEDHEDHEDQEKTPDSRIPPTPITQRDMDTIIIVPDTGGFYLCFRVHVVG